MRCHVQRESHLRHAGLFPDDQGRDAFTFPAADGLQLYQGSQALIQTEDLPALRTPDAPHLEEARSCDVVARHSGYHILDQFDSLRN